MSINSVGAFPGSMVPLSISVERRDVIELLLAAGEGYIHASFDVSRDRGGS